MKLLGGLRGAVSRFLGGSFSSGTFGDPGGWLIGQDLDASFRDYVSNPESALRISTVYACVRVLGNTIGTLPIHYFSRGADRIRQRVPGHPTEYKLNHQPNPELTAPEFWMMVIAHLYLYGNAYIFLQPTVNGGVFGYWPQYPPAIQVSRLDDGSRVFWKTGRRDPFSASEIIHIRLFTIDGNYGLNPIAYHRQNLGLTFSAETFGASFFRNSARPSGVLEVPQELTEDGFQRLKKDWAATYGGTSNTGAPAVLEQGTTWKNISINPNEAQFLDTRKLQTREICKIMGVPPHMVQDLENATFTNIEHQGIDFVRHTIRPLAVLIEKAFTVGLGLEAQNAFVEFDLEGLLRGDQSSRYASYSTALQNGWMTRNEVRDKENLPRIPGEAGNLFTVQLNMAPIDQLGMDPIKGTLESETPATGTEDAPTDPEDNTEDDSTEGTTTRNLIQYETRTGEKSGREYRSSRVRLRLRKQFRGILFQAFARATKRETQDLRRLVKKSLGSRGLEEFETGISEFFGEFWEVARAMLSPAMDSYIRSVMAEATDQVEPGSGPSDESMDQFVQNYIDAMVSRWISSHRGQIRQLARTDGTTQDVEAEILKRLDEWDEKQAEKLTGRESVQAEGAASRFAWAAVGVSFLIWRASGDNCPICDEIDGQIVGINKSFLDAGDRISAKGASALMAENSVNNPPIHAGCDCFIEPA